MSKVHKKLYDKLACGRKITDTIKKVDYLEFDRIIIEEPLKACSQCFWSGWTR